MLISLNWIQDFVKIDSSPEAIAERLNLSGFEVESLRVLGAGLDQVVTATILKRDKHPNADRLSLCEVRAGEKQYSIVCGANNMKAGDRIALALPGAKLPNGLEIKESEIRKVKSQGMLCSETELGLAEKSEGILILNPETPEGIPLKQALNLNDVLLEISVGPNRGDCLSISGLAREIAALFQLPFRAPRIEITSSKSKPSIEVSQEAAELCPRYSCRVLRGVKVGPSPQFIKQRLEACGIRSINNVVDATNYVMLELGQPLHAFDLRHIEGNTIKIRRARADEILHTLDGKERKLSEQDLIIADAKGPLALAGVMGGEHSGVTETTVDLVLESANFLPSAVRTASKRHNLKSESSHRFERSVDPEGSLRALDRLTQLLVEIAAAQTVEPSVDIYPKPQAPLTLSLRASFLKRILGVDLSITEIEPALQALGFKIHVQRDASWAFEIPSFRRDLHREIDLVEEVARVHGYHKIPTHYPQISLAELPPAKLDPLDELRKTLAAWGFAEAMHYSFTSPQLLAQCYQEFSNSLRLLNPISEELSVMRPSLMPQMLQTLQKNIFNGHKNLRYFEIGPVYSVSADSKRPFVQKLKLCMAMSGARRPLHFLEKEEEVSFYDLKGYWETLRNSFFPQQPLQAKLEEKKASEFFHPKRHDFLLISNDSENSGQSQQIGEIGELHPLLHQTMEISVPVAILEVDLEVLLTSSKKIVQFNSFSSYPLIGRDLNLVVDENAQHETILNLIHQQGGPWLRRVMLFDLYRGKPLPEGKKALTYALEFGAMERTLTDQEVNQAREALLVKLREAGCELRA